MAVLGRRHWYRYDSDDTKSYKISTLDYLAEAAGLELDDTLPQLPRGYQPRYIWVQEEEPGENRRPLRKKLVVQKKDLNRLKTGTKLEVAGIKMLVRGYVGEVRRGRAGNTVGLSQVRVEITDE